MRYLSLLTAVMLVACSGSPSGKVTEYGVYEKVSTSEQSFTITGPNPRKIPMGVVKLVEATTRVPGRIGVCFGYRYEIALPEEPISVEITYRHPRLIDPSGKESYGFSFIIDDLKGMPVWSSADHYCFDHEWEIQPGRWSFEISHNGKLMASKEFEVVPK